MDQLLAPPTHEPGDDAPASGGPGPRLTRRRLLGAGLGAGAALLAGGGYGLDRALSSGGDQARLFAPAPSGTVQRFRSRPDLLPTVTSLVRTNEATAGYLFVGPDQSGVVQPGTMILDGRGELTWFAPVTSGKWVTNLQVQTYAGAPALTWWEGKVTDGYGTGEAVIAGTSYREILRVRAARGRTVDLHEFQLTSSGTALFTCTPARVSADLSSLGGPAKATVLESIFQEVELPSGRLVREWRSLGHIAPAESYRAPSATFDYLHVNSLDVLDDGNLLMSARHTWGLYKIDRTSGAVIWRMGGKHSDFQMGPGAQYAWQHDARQVPRGRVTVFDDGYDGVTKTHKHSRGLILGVDEAHRRVRLEREYIHPRGLLTSAMGNTQLLDNGHVVLGFGDDPDTTEFTADGRVVSDLRMPQGQHSYRGFRLGWDGAPTDTPALAAVRDRSRGAATLYASWNGATSVARWRVEGGARRSDLRSLATVARDGFETAIPLGTEEGYARVVALDAAGRQLRASDVIRV
jgi:hypothetical protein